MTSPRAIAKVDATWIEVEVVGSIPPIAGFSLVVAKETHLPLVQAGDRLTVWRDRLVLLKNDEKPAEKKS